MTGIVDAWMQHPTLRLSNHEMLDSLRRWVGVAVFEDEIPLGCDHRGDGCGRRGGQLASAWYGPQGDLISNDEVAAQIAALSGQVPWGRRRRPQRPMEAVRELRQQGRGGFRGAPDRPVALGPAADRPSLLSALRGVRRSR